MMHDYFIPYTGTINGDKSQGYHGARDMRAPTKQAAIEALKLQLANELPRDVIVIHDHDVKLID